MKWMRDWARVFKRNPSLKHRLNTKLADYRVPDMTDTSLYSAIYCTCAPSLLFDGMKWLRDNDHLTTVYDQNIGGVIVCIKPEFFYTQIKAVLESEDV